jgi:hypothetical protein
VAGWTPTAGAGLRPPERGQSGSGASGEAAAPADGETGSDEEDGA